MTCRRRSREGSLPDPDVLAEEIAEDLRSALEQIESVLGDLQERAEATSE